MVKAQFWIHTLAREENIAALYCVRRRFYLQLPNVTDPSKIETTTVTWIFPYRLTLWRNSMSLLVIGVSSFCRR